MTAHEGYTARRGTVAALAEAMRGGALCYIEDTGGALRRCSSIVSNDTTITVRFGRGPAHLTAQWDDEQEIDWYVKGQGDAADDSASGVPSAAIPPAHAVALGAPLEPPEPARVAVSVRMAYAMLPYLPREMYETRLRALIGGKMQTITHITKREFQYTVTLEGGTRQFIDAGAMLTLEQYQDLAHVQVTR